MSAPLALAVDLGGTRLRAAVADAHGRLFARRSVETASAAGPDAVIDQIVALCGEVSAGFEAAAFAGLGVGAPGPFDPLTGRSLAPPTLAGWHDVPLVRRLSDRLRLPVRAENDANAAALGEWRFGAGRGLRSLVFVTVSTGIGGGVIADGRILHGRRGLAAEIGHMTIGEGGHPCFCGTVGCFEALASGSALGWRARDLADGPDGAALRAEAGDQPVTSRHVVALARRGDPLALRLLDEEARWLGIGFTNLLHLYSPEAILMGGGLATALDLLRPGIERVIAERAMPDYRDVPLLAAGLGDDAGLVGAASLVFEHTWRTP